MRRMQAAFALVVVVTLGGCTGHSAGPTPTTTQSLSPTPTPSATTPAAQALQALAGLGAKAAYRATYTVRQTHPRATATWKVWRAPPSLRVDVVTPRQTATLIVTAKASYSCRRATHRKTCFRVAGAGKPVPAPFQLLAQPLFSTDVDSLGRHIDSYVVLAAHSDGATAHVPASTCYDVRPTANAPRPRVEKATYCFSARGVLTSVTYPSGNLVRLEHLSMRAPARPAFVPYSSPTPLPG